MPCCEFDVLSEKMYLDNFFSEEKELLGWEGCFKRRVRMACYSFVLFIEITDQQWNFNLVLQDEWSEALLSTILVCCCSRFFWSFFWFLSSLLWQVTVAVKWRFDRTWTLLASCLLQMKLLYWRCCSTLNKVFSLRPKDSLSLELQWPVKGPQQVTPCIFACEHKTFW